MHSACSRAALHTRGDKRACWLPIHTTGTCPGLARAATVHPRTCTGESRARVCSFSSIDSLPLHLLRAVKGPQRAPRPAAAEGRGSCWCCQTLHHLHESLPLSFGAHRWQGAPQPTAVHMAERGASQQSRLGALRRQHEDAPTSDCDDARVRQTQPLLPLHEHTASPAPQLALLRTKSHAETHHGRALADSGFD